MLINQGELDNKVLFEPSVIARLEAATTALGARAGLDKAMVWAITIGIGEK